MDAWRSSLPSQPTLVTLLPSIALRRRRLPLHAVHAKPCTAAGLGSQLNMPNSQAWKAQTVSYRPWRSHYAFTNTKAVYNGSIYAKLSSPPIQAERASRATLSRTTRFDNVASSLDSCETCT